MGIILKLLLGLLKFILNIVLLPINALIVQLLPDFSSYVSRFLSFINTYLVPLCSYFFNILPPMTREIVFFTILVNIALYTISLSVHTATKFFNVVKKVKFW